jgi:very-short-patch-repair endonuclease
MECRDNGRRYTERRISYNDQLRNQTLMREGWDVIRFWVQQVRDQLPWCIEQVQNWMKIAEN